MYLVDGNNVMGQRVGWHRDKAGARRQLLEDLAHLARCRQIRIGVVFDGRPDQAFPDGSSYQGVKIHYAAPGSDADTRLVELVEASRERRNLTVVTSDGQLTSQIRVRGVKVIRSGELRKWIDAARESGAGEEPAHRIGDDEMGGWLRYFGVDADDE
ncbi:MAG: NYN domain-containing protein [Acidobacteriota bacterium]|jgi:predicted RNA-binding protein with PIN domain